MTDYPPGTPIWVDLGSPDAEGACRFYSELFGWRADVSPDPQAGGYAICSIDGKPVAGIGPLMGEGQPTAWSTYVKTEDADATAAKVEAAGGKVLMAPFDVMDFGRMAVFMDPAGAAFSVWQAGTMPGAELFNVPGALCWNELSTPDTEGAKAFYAAVFGWGAKDSEYPGGTYTEWRIGEKSIAGMMATSGEQPTYWAVYFAVADADATVAKATQLGGSVIVPVTESPAGPFAVLSDPFGAPFSVIKM